MRGSEIPYYRRPGEAARESEVEEARRKALQYLLERTENDRRRTAQSRTTVAAVGQDFVQLREADGTEHYVPLSRVDVVIRPAGK